MSAADITKNKELIDKIRKRLEKNKVEDLKQEEKRRLSKIRNANKKTRKGLK